MRAFLMSVHGCAWLCLSLALASGAARAQNLPVLTDKAGAPIDVHGLAITQTAEVGAVKFDIGPTAEVGTRTFDGTCHSPTHFTLAEYESLFRDERRKVTEWGFDLGSVNRVFTEKMAQRGYPRFAPERSLFVTVPATDADFRIGVTFIAMHFEKCGRYPDPVDGRSDVKVRWEIYSQRRQEVVYAKIVESTFIVGTHDDIPDIEFNKRVVARMVDILQADPDFAAVFTALPKP